jgi:predicted amidohydrolase
LAANGAQLILAPSCTETIRGATRVHIGARARAMEQQVFTAVSQTINEALWSPAVDINYGYAGVYSSPDVDLPEEGILSLGTPELPGWHYQELELSKNDYLREKGQVFNYKDSQRIEMSLPQKMRVEHVKL